MHTTPGLRRKPYRRHLVGIHMRVVTSHLHDKNIQYVQHGIVQDRRDEKK